MTNKIQPSLTTMTRPELESYAKRMQSELAAQQSPPPHPCATDDAVLVSREQLLDWYGEMPNWECSAQMRACLDAPAPRVVGPGDVVIPAVVVERAVEYLLQFGIPDGEENNDKN